MDSRFDPSPRLIERFDEILDYLKQGTDTRASFFAAIESQKSDLRLLGARLADTIEENEKLQRALALPVPNFTVNVTVTSEPFYNEQLIKIEYSLENQHFKMAVSNQTAYAWRREDKLRRVLRWRAYIGMCRSLRGMLDRALHEAKL